MRREKRLSLVHRNSTIPALYLAERMECDGLAGALNSC
jgi:hypothetical protein